MMLLKKKFISIFRHFAPVTILYNLRKFLKISIKIIKLNVNILVAFLMKTESFGRFYSVQSRIDFLIKFCSKMDMHA